MPGTAPAGNPTSRKENPLEHPTTQSVRSGRPDRGRDHGDGLRRPGGTSTGPNTTTKPYVLPVGDGVSVTSLLTVGDGAASNGYEMVGIPDGLGLVRSEDGDRDFSCS